MFALLRAFAAQGERVVGMKPVAAGWLEGASVNADVVALSAAGNVVAQPEHVYPYSFALPVAPHLAARHSRSTRR